MGFRKGADLDEELWPTETFGGVTDEQFWDDLAADKPLATTARTAQQDSAARRGGSAGSASGGYAGPPAGAYAGPATGAYAGSPTGPGPGADRTAIQPAYTAPQPTYPAAPPAHAATQPVQAAPPPAHAAPQPVSGGIQPVPVADAGRQAGEARGRRRRNKADAEDDPLTSAAFSLRPRGPVDGRSQAPRRTRDGEPAWGGPRPGGPDTGTAGGYGGTSSHPYAAASYGNPPEVGNSSNTPPYGGQAVNTQPYGTRPTGTPPYGENYGYGPPGPARADGQRRQNGYAGQAGQAGNGSGGRRALRQPYPQDAHQPSGYPGASGYPDGGKGYQGGAHRANGYHGGGYPPNGYRSPHDPGDGYRRLVHQ